MSGSHKLLFTFALAILLVVGMYTVRGLGQSSAASGIVVNTFAPPPIDHGLVARFSRSPDSPESQIRSAIRLGNSPLDRVGIGGAHYVAGKLIVKFRSGTSSASKASARSVVPAIDMERAWDIQPAAGSNIIVAVLDTGVAYTNVTMKYHANAFRIDADLN